MKVAYRWGNHEQHGDVIAPSFFLSNNAEGFFHGNAFPQSVYHGLFFSDGIDSYRTLENIQVQGNVVKSFEQKFYEVVRKGSLIDEAFFMPVGKDALLYELNENANVLITLDVKKAYDNRLWGRNYTMSRKKDCTVIRFEKVSDSREDKSHGEREFVVYIALRHDGKTQPVNRWIERMYEDDAGRHESGVRWVFEAMSFEGKKCAIAVSKKEEQAILMANKVFNSGSKLKAEKSKHLHALPYRSLEQFAAHNALNLLATNHGIHAGHPWFFQYWSRDSLISAKALPLPLRRKIILSYLPSVQRDGNLPNRMPASKLGAADAVGWLFFRASELYNDLALTEQEERKIRAAVMSTIANLRKHHVNTDIVYSNVKETWMDTQYNDNGRFGARIEIQALTLAMYRFAAELTAKTDYKKYELQLREKVLKHFYLDGLLKDGIDDATCRPNIFIAAYVYPQLLSNEEWKMAIMNTLNKLWLEWGGLASLDTSHPDFFPNDLGNDNRSYHHGDSWYWLNNLAAIVMHRIDKNEFASYIRKIKEASLHNLLWQRSLGSCSELSSASHQTSSGCLNQAWSDAMLIELLQELHSPQPDT
jgi:hypothetical protein